MASRRLVDGVDGSSAPHGLRDTHGARCSSCVNKIWKLEEKGGEE
jgi:hypothetical protein